ncbi:MAG: hypothetical protein F6K39_37545 [Okeania sp. SIO3B3]|nr:hypothetical protein [Okeania sp. SIO3B3]
MKTPYVGANGIRPHLMSVSVRKSCKCYEESGVRSQESGVRSQERRKEECL